VSNGDSWFAMEDIDIEVTLVSRAPAVVRRAKPISFARLGAYIEKVVDVIEHHCDYAETGWTSTRGPLADIEKAESRIADLQYQIAQTEIDCIDGIVRDLFRNVGTAVRWLESNEALTAPAIAKDERGAMRRYMALAKRLQVWVEQQSGDTTTSAGEES